jgi:hypothetical protein
LIAKNLLTGSLKNRSIDNLETQMKSISMKNSQFFDYLLYAKINIEGKIGQLTVRRTSSFNMRQATCLKDEILKFQ